MRELYPTAEDVGQRMDAWLATLFPSCSKATLRDLLKMGALRYNGRTVQKGDRVHAGVYMLSEEPQETQLQANPTLPLEILYEDEVLLAVNKPAGMDCQPHRSSEKDTLANALLAYDPQVLGVGDTPLTCGILHRIDCDTSGLVLVAKTQATYDNLREQFSAHTIEKHYLALVSGTPHSHGHLEHFLAHNPRCPGRMINAELWHDAKRPMRAVTDYRLIRNLIFAGEKCSLLDVTIYTGVTHQIRAQLSLVGLPILGDKRYGGVQFPNVHRHFLHAHRATFLHPISHQKMTLEAPLTSDFGRLGL